MITINNLRTTKPSSENDYICDRDTELGNPFRVIDESLRDEVCENYSYYFKKQKLWETGLFQRMLTKVKAGEDINLFCWCAPKRCHCETIKKALEYFSRTRI